MFGTCCVCVSLCMDVFSGGEVCVDHSLDYDLSRWQHCVCVLHVQCRGTSPQVQFHSFVSDDPSLLITCIKHPSDLCYLGCFLPYSF